MFKISRRHFIAVSVFAIVSTALFFFILRKGNPSESVTGAFFLSGLLHILIGLSCLVRNGGAFKTLGYFGYRRNKKNIKNRIESGMAPPSTHIPDFAEYVMSKYEKKWNGIPFYFSGGALIIISFIIPMFFK